MTKTFDIDFYDGHLIINNDGQKVLVDTGSPVSIGRSNHFLFMDQEHNCMTSYLGQDINAFAEMIGYDIDVLMGMDVIGNYNMLTDYKSAKVTFSTEDIPFESVCIISIAQTKGVFFVVLKVKGEDVRLFLDTGAKISYIAETYTSGETAIEVLEDFYPMIGQFTTPIYAMEASIGGQSFPVKFGKLPKLIALPLQMVGIEGIIGYDLFSKYKVLLDFHNNRMLLME